MICGETGSYKSSGVKRSCCCRSLPLTCVSVLMTYIASSNTACAMVCVLAFISSSSSICILLLFSSLRWSLQNGWNGLHHLFWVCILKCSEENANDAWERERGIPMYWSLSFPCMEQEWALVGLCCVLSDVLQAFPIPHRSTVNVCVCVIWIYITELFEVLHLQLCNIVHVRFSLALGTDGS